VYGDEDDGADVRNARAAKAAGHELGGLACWEQFAPSNADGTQAFRLPLMCLVDYRGYRLLAISWISWLGNDTQIMGSNDGMHVLFNRRGGAAELHERVGEAAARMKLRLHIAGRSPSAGMPNYDVWDGCRPVELYTAFDVEGHKSRDGQFYLVCFQLFSMAHVCRCVC
jgi:Clustered mitochondria